MDEQLHKWMEPWSHGVMDIGQTEFTKFDLKLKLHQKCRITWLNNFQLRLERNWPRVPVQTSFYRKPRNSTHLCWANRATLCQHNGCYIRLLYWFTERMETTTILIKNFSYNYFLYNINKGKIAYNRLFLFLILLTNGFTYNRK